MSIESRKITTVHIGALRAAGARPLYRGVFVPSAGLRRRSGDEDTAADRARSLASLDPTVVLLLGSLLFRAWWPAWGRPPLLPTVRRRGLSRSGRTVVR